ncbi:T-cell receptor alpha chain V region PY14 [Tupaia chinensis]|nr:T-cell receptor alpha chain V region PY14 [Tupaia chinensis]
MDAYEGQEVNMSCSHSSIATNEYIFWYRQFPNQGPQFFVQGYKTNIMNEASTLFIPGDRKSSILSLHRAALEDTAVYYCIVADTVRRMGLHLCRISVGGTRAQSVTQPDVHVAVPEGAHLELRCNYSSSVPPSLFWYVQYPNQGLQLLLKYTSGNSLVTGIKNFEAEFRKSETSFHLKKTSAHLSDSAGYFCALSNTVLALQGELNTNFW